jgi:hypothetical protein
MQKYIILSRRCKKVRMADFTKAKTGDGQRNVSRVFEIGYRDVVQNG